MPNIVTGPMLKVLGAAGAVLLCGIILYLNWGMPAPRETERFGPANGEFSIIRPRDWDVSHPMPGGAYVAAVEAYPPRAVGLPERLVVGRLRLPPDQATLAESKLTPGQFQGQPAWIFQGWIKRDFYWKALFERNGAWYEIILRLNQQEDVPASGWWSYLNSFQSRPPPTSNPATRATLPVS
jgi:hypothetical protein